MFGDGFDKVTCLFQMNGELVMNVVGFVRCLCRLLFGKQMLVLSVG